MQNKNIKGRPGTGKPGGSGPARPSRPAGGPEVRSLDNPRLVAVRVLDDVLGKEAYAAFSLDDRLNGARLIQLDRRLCASIVYRTLENLYLLDYALSGFLKEPENLNMTVRNILRTAACQILLHDRIPDSAAVNEAVRLTRVMDLEGFSGMVNAVLRRLVDHRDEIVWPGEDEGARFLSIRFSLPEWLAEQLIRDYGFEEARAIVSFRTEKHAVILRPTYGREKEFRERLDKKVWEKEDGLFPGAVRVFGAVQIARDSDYLSGLFSVQGEGSMIAAESVGVRPGMNVLDCCAAPGGKTAYLAERMEGTGRVYAWDLHSHRVELIRAMTRRLHLENVRMAVRDAKVFREEMEGRMDAVLLDAPCSGLGVMDDKPDVKYRHDRESVDALVLEQRMLLDACCRYVKPGGILVYSTCSILKDENDRQIARFLSDHPEFFLDALPVSVPAVFRDRTGEYGLQLLPCRDGVEGFFVARLKRKG